MRKINDKSVGRAVELLKTILKYMGIDSGNEAGLEERIELVGQLYKQTLKCSDVQDELFNQILKQTRNCPEREHLIRAWELMYLCASCMAPSTDGWIHPSAYIHYVAHDANIDPDVQVLAVKALHALEGSAKAERRRTIPGREEIEALLIGKKLTTTVFFLDGTSEEITYGMTTTVANVVEELAGVIKLSAYSSFGLFECHTSPESGNEEYIGLDDNKYIGDLLAEFKSTKVQSDGEISQCKLTFKKKLFLESEEAVADPMFVQLSYDQLHRDYILGNYPVGKGEAAQYDVAQLSALQILVEIGYVVNLESSTEWTLLPERYLPGDIARTCTTRDWKPDIFTRYRSMENLTKHDARQEFLRILRRLPYGHSVFFSAHSIHDERPPKRIILGINKHGVHFFRPAPRAHLHSVELGDILQYWNMSNTRLGLWIRVDGGRALTFETEQAEEICVALETIIYDILDHYSKAHSADSTDSLSDGGGDPPTNSKPPSVDATR